MYLRTISIEKSIRPRDNLVYNNSKYVNDTAKLVNLQ